MGDYARVIPPPAFQKARARTLTAVGGCWAQRRPQQPGGVVCPAQGHKYGLGDLGSAAAVAGRGEMHRGKAPRVPSDATLIKWAESVHRRALGEGGRARSGRRCPPGGAKASRPALVPALALALVHASFLPGDSRTSALLPKTNLGAREERKTGFSSPAPAWTGADVAKGRPGNPINYRAAEQLIGSSADLFWKV